MTTTSRAGPRSVPLAILALLLLSVRGQGAATPPVKFEGVAATVHNLSVSGPGEIRSLSETEICKFCHIPHNAVVNEPLWGHTLSEAEYRVPRLRRGRTRGPTPQPDGSSRLCLSCHDGTIALGDLAGKKKPIEFRSGGRFQPGDRGFLGTDLTGSHPISFVLEDAPEGAFDDDTDIGIRTAVEMRSDPDVPIDKSGKMQCTTCHDAHSDRNYVPGVVPRFWVKSSVDEVCTTCHVSQ